MERKIPPAGKTLSIKKWILEGKNEWQPSVNWLGSREKEKSIKIWFRLYRGVLKKEVFAPASIRLHQRNPIRLLGRFVGSD